MIFDFKVVTEWFDNLLNGFMPAWATTVVECVLIGVGLLVVYALLALFYIYFERKVCGAFQCRLGPNRVGPLGLLQSFADMFKILIKELIPLQYRQVSFQLGTVPCDCGVVCRIRGSSMGKRLADY